MIRPVNQVRVADNLRQLVVDECVVCGETHYHGARDRAVAMGRRSPRGAHCRDEAGEYLLELAPEADPPERWFRWLGVSETARERGEA